MTTQQLRHLAAICQTKLISASDMILLLTYNRFDAGWQIKDLVDFTQLRASTITMAKNNLKASGMLTEHVPARDARTAKIYLTKDGRAAARSRWKAIQQLAGMEASITDSMPPN